MRGTLLHPIGQNFSGMKPYQYEQEYTDEEMVVRRADQERERERGQLTAIKTKVITPRKIVLYKCCFPRTNISLKMDFDVL